MTIALRDLTTLNSDTVSQNLALATEAVQELNPTIDATRGVVHDVVLTTHAILEAQLQENVADYLSARSLLDIQADPTLADPTLVDAVLSNFNIVRNPGALATGEVAVVVSSPATLILPVGFVFQADGNQFVTDQVYTAKSQAGQVIAPGDRLLTARGDGTYFFTVNVVAAVAGAASQPTKNTLMAPATLPANYVTSYAVSDFTGGVDAETNEELLARQQQGIACKAPSNEVNMAALLRAQPEFATFPALAVIGMGDEEMLRDRHSILPISVGGRVDWYVRTAQQAVASVLTKTATCLSTSVATQTSVWQFSLARDDAPGFYEVLGILPASGTVTIAGNGWTPDADVRGLDFADDDWASDVLNLTEGDYSRYATAVIQFTDTLTPLSGIAPGATADYDVTVVSLPQIADVQAFLAAEATRSRVADILVRAPIPCFVVCAMTVYKSASEADPDLAAIQTALAAVINRTAFGQGLYASALQTAAAPYLSPTMRLGPVTMAARLRLPGGTLLRFQSTSLLTIPSRPADTTTPRTAQFFSTPPDIHVTVAAV